jgi:hypothetical protein
MISLALLAVFVLSNAAIVAGYYNYRLEDFRAPHNKRMQTDEPWTSPSRASPPSILRPSGSG